ncbi:DUF4007 family protein [Pedobacter aquatilis]|uniref:DUF4007 family protein n=1 Tax=Pedobacter aquatilis TaxID=351343 RepID=UPI0025B40F53|nr:DUF4007 family protein [Pedobacter aquatilis]MDN3586099.1 DUF4007 family protein [Pedobacter aquatilis]
MKFSFSGHETFACKNYWLKKGLDYIRQTGKSFGDDNAVVALGVGKNMVNSIRFWLRAFSLIDEAEKPTEFADFIFGQDGTDLYLEDTISLWLLHYQLIKGQKASIYSLVFDHFRRERQDFTKAHLKRFLQRKIQENKENFSENTLDSDIKTFLNNYLSANPLDIEEGYINVLQELGLISHFTQLDDHNHKIDWYRFDSSPKMDLPIEAMLFIVMDNPDYGNSISLSALANDEGSLGSVFLLTEIALRDKLSRIDKAYGVFSETAGNPVLQLKEEGNKWEILKRYYEGSSAAV